MENCAKRTKVKQKTEKIAEKKSEEKETKCDTSIFPQKVGDKAIFKEVEVTMTKGEQLNSASVKKKGKKKKGKSCEIVSTKLDTSPSDCDSSAPLLHFKESGVDLLNRPEISVTVTDASFSQIPDPVKNTNAEQLQAVSSVESTSSKKKKKKKKKKKQAELLSQDEVDATSTTGKVLEESVSAPPTYVKLPATGDTCVLVVSHENFGNSNNNLNKDGTHISGLAAVIDKAKNNNSHKINSSISQHVNMGSDTKGLGYLESSPALCTTSLLNDTSCFLNSSNSMAVVSNNCSKVIHSDLDLDSKAEKNDKLIGINLNEIKGLSPDVSIKSPLKNSVTTVGNDNIAPKLSKAERRALQEAQRAAKLAKNGLTLTKTDNEHIKVQSAKPKETVKEKTKISGKEKSHKVSLFSHLPQFKSYNLLSKHLSNIDIHPAIIAVGTQFATGIICGSNARCIALLAAFREVIKDYITPPNKELSRDLESKFQTYINFIANFRPLSVSMLNAVKFLKYQVTHIPNDKNDYEAKKLLYSQIEKFINEDVLLAKDAICSFAAAKIVNGDVILTYAYSSVVKEVLCEAFEQKKEFRVIIIDSRPKMEGQELLRCLVKKGIPCSYTLINAVSHVMKEVSKVIVGAHALQANGYVMSRVGCSQVALVASWYNVPVLVCCETYKFCERVHTDSFVYNELGDPLSLVKTHQSKYGTLENWKEIPTLQLLNLLYDITPPELVTMVVTEKGMLPCTSVPVVLRVRHAYSHDQ